MDDKDIDKLFQDHLSYSKMEVDVDSVWKHLRNKKRRRLLFILLLSGIAILSIVATVIYSQSSNPESSAEIAESNLVELQNNTESSIIEGSEIIRQVHRQDAFYNDSNSFEEDQIETAKHVLKGEDTKGEEQSEIIFNDTDLSRPQQREFLNTVDIYKEALTNRSEISSIVKNSSIRNITKALNETSRNTGSTLPEYSEDSQMQNTFERIESENRIHQEFTLISKIDILRLDPNRLELMDVVSARKLDTKSVIESQNFEVFINTGIGTFTSHFSGDSDFVSARNKYETDRFSTYIDLGLNIWKTKFLGLSLNGMYQKNYSYFEAMLDKTIYKVERNETSHYVSYRNIKSNIIIDQFHFSVLGNVRLVKNRFTVIGAVGPSYNVSTSGTGKFLLLDELKNYSEDKYLVNSGIGLQGKLQVQYILTDQWKINVATNYLSQSGDIFRDEALEQKLRTVYFTSGISYSF